MLGCPAKGPTEDAKSPKTMIGVSKKSRIGLSWRAWSTFKFLRPFRPLDVTLPSFGKRAASKSIIEGAFCDMVVSNSTKWGRIWRQAYFEFDRFGRSWRQGGLELDHSGGIARQTLFGFSRLLGVKHFNRRSFGSRQFNSDRNQLPTMDQTAA